MKTLILSLPTGIKRLLLVGMIVPIWAGLMEKYETVLAVMVFTSIYWISVIVVVWVIDGFRGSRRGS